MPTTAYNPYDPTQQGFLSALALGESSGSHPYSQGVGGVDLSGAPTDASGFPQWGGFGNSHAAGAFQFQPATWDAEASAHGLNFQNPADQNAAAWYLAQDTYSAKTGGDLATDLKAGKFSSVQSALASVWPSVTGNAAAPGGLVASLTGGKGANIAGGNPTSADTSGGIGSMLSGLNPFAGIANNFVRIGLIAVGVVILVVALWYLLSDAGVVPSPGDTAKAAGKLAVVAAA